MEYNIYCPYCNKLLQVSDEWFGIDIACPVCDRTFSLNREMCIIDEPLKENNSFVDKINSLVSNITKRIEENRFFIDKINPFADNKKSLFNDYKISTANGINIKRVAVIVVAAVVILSVGIYGGCKVTASVCYEKGCKYMSRGDEEEGVEYLKISADLGHLKAQKRLGDYYLSRGEWGYNAAANYYRDAARQGDKEAKEMYRFIKSL